MMARRGSRRAVVTTTTIAAAVVAVAIWRLEGHEPSSPLGRDDDRGGSRSRNRDDDVTSPGFAFARPRRR
jgi:hypothetical protein